MAMITKAIYCKDFKREQNEMVCSGVLVKELVGKGELSPVPRPNMELTMGLGYSPTHLGIPNITDLLS